MAGRASSSSSSSFRNTWTYDVFLSFRGEDTRHHFTGNLYKELHTRGIPTFMDDREIQKGEQITQSLPDAIEGSRIAIVVLSENYASSSFCLDELVKILECIKGKDQLVLPIFYHVDPSDVRHLRGSYEKAMTEQEKKFKDDKEKVQKWREALTKAANLSGWHFKDGVEYEHEFIEKIVEVVSNKINRVPLHVANYPVGLQSRVQAVERLLDVSSDDEVRMVGIFGTGGIGKTTLARAVYNSIADKFDGLCFLGDVRENSNNHGLPYLQEMLLSKIIGEKDIKLGSVNEGIPIIEHRLSQKKILLILDDVDKVEQLRALVGRPDWFGPGSRVLITTRDKQLLECHWVDKKYEAEELNEEDALELLSRNAFKTNKVVPSYMNIFKKVTAWASGLPLVLEVIGSHLSGKSEKIWESALDQYKSIPNKDIQRILKVSFDALEETQQNIFLDIACSFRGDIWADIEHRLYALYGPCSKYCIEVLVDKCLIKIIYGCVILHDLIQDMGKEIVRQESPEDPGERSRLWISKDIVEVLENNSGTSKIQMMILDFHGGEVEVDCDKKAFKKMKNLKTLIIRNARFSKGPKYLPNSLRVLEWWGYPSRRLPPNFHPKNLVIFKVPKSRLLQVELVKKCGNLIDLNLDNCKYISEIPDVSGIPNLEKFSFEGCENLIKIHSSVGSLDKLRILRANRCTKLKTFPPIGLTSLEYLDLYGCSSLENFPEVTRKMENIIQLSLVENPMIKELPSSVRNLTRLQSISLEDCGMCQLPSSIVMLPELMNISIRHSGDGLYWSKDDGGKERIVSWPAHHINPNPCIQFDKLLPEFLTWFKNVTVVFLVDINLTVLPSCIEKCALLKDLFLGECKHLREIRGIPPNLERFSARNCKSLTSSCRSMLLNQELPKAGRYKMFCSPFARMPEWGDRRSNEASISFWFRNKFPAIVIFLHVGVVGDKAGGCFSMIINGVCSAREITLSTDHIYFFVPPFDDVDEALLKNEWNHAEVSICHFFRSEDFHLSVSLAPIKEIRIHVLKQESSMENIRFTSPHKSTSPYKRRKLNGHPMTWESKAKWLLNKSTKEGIACWNPEAGFIRR